MCSSISKIGTNHKPTATSIPETLLQPPSRFETARYLYKMGIVVTDDIIKCAAKNCVLPLDGALVVRLRSPVACVFISYGLCGMALPDSKLCAIGDSWNSVLKEETFALSRLMSVLDYEHKLCIRRQWFLIDMKETNAKIIRNPTNEEIAGLYKTYSAMKSSDVAKYKLIARIARRRNTAGADTPDGHEDDSDKDPLTAYLHNLAHKEERAEKARKKRLGIHPDTEAGRKAAKTMREFKTTPKCVSETLTKEEESKLAKKRTKGNQSFFTVRTSKKKSISYTVDPIDSAQEKNDALDQNLERASFSSPCTMENLFGDSFGEDNKTATTSKITDGTFAQTSRSTLNPKQLPQYTNPSEQQSEHLDYGQVDFPTEEECCPLQSECADEENVIDDECDEENVIDYCEEETN